MVDLKVKGESAGLFGYVSGAKIKNIQISGEVKGVLYAGGVCGQAENSDIRYCFNTSKVSGMYSGGVVGRTINGGSYTDMANSGTIVGSTACGGVIGYAAGGG